MATTLYLWTQPASQASGVATAPAGFLGAWTQQSANAGSAAFSLQGSADTATQYATAPTWSSIAASGSASLGHAQFISQPLQAQTISAGSWTFGWASALSNASSTLEWQGYAALYLVNGATGAIRTTIFALGGIGSSGRSATGELTSYSASVSGAAATATLGDYLVFECGINVANTGGAAATPTSAIYTDGATTISSDDSSATSPKSFLTATVALAFASAALPGDSVTPGTLVTETPLDDISAFDTPRNVVLLLWRSDLLLRQGASENLLINLVNAQGGPATGVTAASDLAGSQCILTKGDGTTATIALTDSVNWTEVNSTSRPGTYQIVVPSSDTGALGPGSAQVAPGTTAKFVAASGFCPFTVYVDSSTYASASALATLQTTANGLATLTQLASDLTTITTAINGLASSAAALTAAVAVVQAATGTTNQNIATAVATLTAAITAAQNALSGQTSNASKKTLDALDDLKRATADLATGRSMERMAAAIDGLALALALRR